jgi:hypothetical protein
MRKESVSRVRKAERPWTGSNIVTKARKRAIKYAKIARASKRANRRGK